MFKSASGATQGCHLVQEEKFEATCPFCKKTIFGSCRSTIMRKKAKHSGGSSFGGSVPSCAVGKRGPGVSPLWNELDVKTFHAVAGEYDVPLNPVVNFHSLFSLALAPRNVAVAEKVVFRDGARRVSFRGSEGNLPSRERGGASLEEITAAQEDEKADEGEQAGADAQAEAEAQLPPLHPLPPNLLPSPASAAAASASGTGVTAVASSGAAEQQQKRYKWRRKPRPKSFAFPSVSSSPPAPPARAVTAAVASSSSASHSLPMVLPTLIERRRRSLQEGKKSGVPNLFGRSHTKDDDDWWKNDPPTPRPTPSDFHRTVEFRRRQALKRRRERRGAEEAEAQALGKEEELDRDLPPLEPGPKMPMFEHITGSTSLEGALRIIHNASSDLLERHRMLKNVWDDRDKPSFRSVQSALRTMQRHEDCLDDALDVLRTNNPVLPMPFPAPMRRQPEHIRVARQHFWTSVFYGTRRLRHNTLHHPYPLTQPNMPPAGYPVGLACRRFVVWPPHRYRKATCVDESSSGRAAPSVFLSFGAGGKRVIPLGVGGYIASFLSLPDFARLRRVCSSCASKAILLSYSTCLRLQPSECKPGVLPLIVAFLSRAREVDLSQVPLQSEDGGRAVTGHVIQFLSAICQKAKKFIFASANHAALCKTLTRAFGKKPEMGLTPGAEMTGGGSPSEKSAMIEVCVERANSNSVFFRVQTAMPFRKILRHYQSMHPEVNKKVLELRWRDGKEVLIPDLAPVDYCMGGRVKVEVVVMSSLQYAEKIWVSLFIQGIQMPELPRLRFNAAVTTPFSKLVESYSRNVGVRSADIRLFFEGDEIDQEKNPFDLNLQENAILEVRMKDGRSFPGQAGRVGGVTGVSSAGGGAPASPSPPAPQPQANHPHPSSPTQQQQQQPHAAAGVGAAAEAVGGGAGGGPSSPLPPPPALQTQHQQAPPPVVPPPVAPPAAVPPQTEAAAGAAQGQTMPAEQHQ